MSDSAFPDDRMREICREAMRENVIEEAYQSACKLDKKLHGIRNDLLVASNYAEDHDKDLAKVLRLIQHHLGELETDIENTAALLRKGME